MIVLFLMCLFMGMIIGIEIQKYYSNKIIKNYSNKIIKILENKLTSVQQQLSDSESKDSPSKSDKSDFR